MSPAVSIIIPCKNEKDFIGAFLDSLLLQEYPKDRLEVLIADGMSNDGTREIIARYQQQYPSIQLLDNPKTYTPSGLNAAIKQTKGEIIIRMDCHAQYEKDYIAKCVQYLEQYHADNVGGTMKTVPSVPTLAARSIALCLSDGLGVGNSYFRKGSKVVRQVDTVFGGCYRKEVFEKIGLFNERLMRSQDLDFNLRLKKAGGKIMLVPDIVSYYHPKATFGGFLKHTFIDGMWAILPLPIVGYFFKLRHYLPLVGITTLLFLVLLSFFSKKILLLLLFILALYVFAVLVSSLRIAINQKDMKLLGYLPVAFVIRNVAYGIGSFFGIFLVLRTFVLAENKVR